MAKFFLFVFLKDIEDAAATSTAPPAPGVEDVNQEQGETFSF